MAAGTNRNDGLEWPIEYDSLTNEKEYECLFDGYYTNYVPTIDRISQRYMEVALSYTYRPMVYFYN